MAVGPTYGSSTIHLTGVADLFWLGIEHADIWALVVHTLKSSVAIHNVAGASSQCECHFE
jgi:hypothetical protein